MNQVYIRALMIACLSTCSKKETQVNLLLAEKWKRFSAFSWEPAKTHSRQLQRCVVRGRSAKKNYNVLQFWVISTARLSCLTGCRRAFSCSSRIRQKKKKKPLLQAILRSRWVFKKIRYPNLTTWQNPLGAKRTKHQSVWFKSRLINVTLPVWKHIIISVCCTKT